jgi:predicted glutamine amidotransferase
MDENHPFRRSRITKMCRLLGIVASELTEFGLGLTEAPRCLAKLSREHRDGWGIAVHRADHTQGEPHAGQRWLLHKGTEPAVDDHRFHALAASSRGHLLVAHIRQKTIGPTRLENTHPFVSDGWVFAHNGTIQHQDGLRAGCSGRRLREITGDTDSELFFAYVLTRMDERGLVHLDRDADGAMREELTQLLHELTAELRAQRIGAFNFLLSDGQTTFAHRFGRSLFVLERTPSDPVREVRPIDDAATITTKWTARRKAILIASERTTDEPWREVDDGTLLRIDRAPVPQVVTTGAAGQCAAQCAGQRAAS